MKANSRNEALVESMRDESPLMIIEKEEEARRRESFFVYSLLFVLIGSLSKVRLFSPAFSSFNTSNLITSVTQPGLY